MLELTALPSIEAASWVAAVQEADALLVAGSDVWYLCRWMRESGLAEHLPPLREEVDLDGQVTIRAIGWFDLRDPGSWGPQVAAAKATEPLLHQLRAVLGYS